MTVGISSNDAEYVLHLNTTSTRLESGSESYSISEELLKNIEVLRHQLVQLALERGSFLSDDVIKLSQWLDQYIVAIQNHISTQGRPSSRQ